MRSLRKEPLGRRLFRIFNTMFLLFVSLACIFPIVYVLSLSLSSREAVSQGLVKLWPVDFTLASYAYVLKKTEFWTSMWVTIQRAALGLAVNMLLTVLAAYPLSKSTSTFRSRTIYVWYFVITMLVNGGLVPTFMVVRQTGLIDSLWALVLPGAVAVFHVVLLLNFFRDLPKELEEAALIDGAGHWRVLWRIFIPISKPALATIILFTLVGHWNEWFSGLIYMNRPSNYPMQSYLQTVIVQTSLSDMASMNLTDMMERMQVSDRTYKAAQIFIGAVPILCVYPFLQKYFTKGLVLGSVKG